MDLVSHYAAVRKRIVNAGRRDLPPPPPPAPPLVEETREETAIRSWPKRPLFEGARLSDAAKADVRPILVHYDLTWREIWCDSREARLHPPRRLIWHALARRGLSLPEIGRLTNRDHTTVLHGLRRIHDIERRNPGRKGRDARGILKRVHDGPDTQDFLRLYAELADPDAGTARGAGDDRDETGADPQRRPEDDRPLG